MQTIINFKILVKEKSKHFLCEILCEILSLGNKNKFSAHIHTQDFFNSFFLPKVVYFKEKIVDMAICK